MKIELFESNQIEFKEEFNEDTKKSIWKSICAFNNTNGGKIYIGIKDDRTIIGVDKKDIDEISKSISNHINDIKKQNSICIEYETYEGKDVIVIVISSSDKLWTNKKELIIRCGTSNRSLTDKELEFYLLKIDKYNEKLNNRFKNDFNLLGYISWNFFEDKKIDQMEKIYSRIVEINNFFSIDDEIEILKINNFAFFNNSIYFDVHLGFVYSSKCVYLQTIKLKINEKLLFECEKNFFNKILNTKYFQNDLDSYNQNLIIYQIYQNIERKKDEFNKNIDNYKKIVVDLFSKNL